MKPPSAVRPCYFLDSTALAKVFFREQGSERVRALHEPTSSNVLATTRLAAVEVVAGIFRRVTAGDLDAKTGDQTSSAIMGLVEARYVIQEITGPTTNLALKLIAAHRLPAPSALQLAAARELKRLRPELRVVFVSSDPALAAAARAESLAHEDPAKAETKPA